ncbi:MAG TPA: D-alanyl-D-alanine carboxypeptidase/D-alanyl-D-alanine-endopeptidase [Gallionella sp.]|nr:D-alanyl-D-alanine carboxypeptidase/D-alanyl-D-alanine-endopeptidase [Gallionella sp.]
MKTGFFYVLFIILCVAITARADTLPSTVRDALQQAHIPLSGVGIEVREVNARKSLISVNVTQPMNPASTMKLLTTYAGLDILGPSYNWKTEAWLAGKLENGTLYGDLVLKGYGDPKFTVEQLWLWLRELRGRGLREIRGDLVLDRSAFESEPFDPGAFDNDPTRAYNVNPDALLLNFNAIRLHLIPDDEKVVVLTEPELAGITLENHVTRVTQGDCENWNDAVGAQLSGTRLLVQGPFSAACGERTEYVNLLPHPEYVSALFRALWQELGGTLSGTSRGGTVPASATLFATHTSQPLSELIRDINKFSNNVMARQLFLSLSAPTPSSGETGGETVMLPASPLRSSQIVHEWLEQKQLDFPELVLENGAGLSRKERISARSMTLLLQAAQDGPLQAEFEASLPIVGVDGSMKKRLKQSAAANHAHLKSGTLEGVKTVAGYVQSRSGKQWTIVFFINHPDAKHGQAAQDALIEWVQQR